jgi:hypothetical protein
VLGSNANGIRSAHRNRPGNASTNFPLRRRANHLYDLAPFTPD